MKYILCNTDKGQVGYPLKFVAEQYANYYSKVDGFEIGSDLWQEEFEYIKEDNYEGIDWMLNNMNWKEVYKNIFFVSNKIIAQEDFFTDSENFKVVKL